MLTINTKLSVIKNVDRRANIKRRRKIRNKIRSRDIYNWRKNKISGPSTKRKKKQKKSLKLNYSPDKLFEPMSVFVSTTPCIDLIFLIIILPMPSIS